jgi:hypothetical protein
LIARDVLGEAEAAVEAPVDELEIPVALLAHEERLHCQILLLLKKDYLL